MAIDSPTKMYWDWSTAGQEGRVDDPHTYLKKKGSFQYAQNIRPEYYWYNGRAYRYLTGDKIDPSKTVQINYPLGDASDPEAKIWPFKVHRGRQIYDTEYLHLLAPRTSAEGGYWSEFDWDKAARLGAEDVGITYSGHYGFVDTEMFWPLSHMVQSKEKALQCIDCHGPRGVMDWQRLGFDGDPAYRGQPALDGIAPQRGGGRGMTRSAFCLLVVLVASPAFAAHNCTLELHPPVTLLDQSGSPVLSSGEPVSTVRSCGACHDAGFITSHCYHANAGLDARFLMGTLAGRRPWDYSPGSFGRWNPLYYRFLSPPGDPKLDLGTAEWIQEFGARHVGGGPALTGHSGTPLGQTPDADSGPDTPMDPDRQVLNPLDRTPEPWDWQASGTVEMNCFLCHLDAPDNQARIQELRAGRFAWANTATLQSTGVVRRDGQQWVYDESKLSAGGRGPRGRSGVDQAHERALRPVPRANLFRRGAAPTRSEPLLLVDGDQGAGLLTAAGCSIRGSISSRSRTSAAPGTSTRPRCSNATTATTR